MSDSILLTIRESVIGNRDDEHFDSVLMMHINTTLSILKQIGVNENNNFSVTGLNETWTEFIGEGLDYDLIKSYVYLKVKVLFDPSASASILAADNANIDELEWRIEEAVNDRKRKHKENGDDKNCELYCV